MLEIIKQAIETHKLIRSGERVLIAFSGGRDSVVLAHTLHRLGYSIGLAHVNYQLRGDESDGDEAFARQFAETLKAPIYVQKLALEKGSNLQERARNIRYSFFEQLAESEGYQRIATAHHQDDQVETVLIQIVRGASLLAIAGIPRQRDQYIRPLLDVSRKDIDEYIRQNDLGFREDSSNQTTDYLRNLLRLNTIPELKSKQADLAQNVLSVAQRLQEQNDAIESLAHSWLERDSVGKQNIRFEQLPENNRSFWLHAACKNFGFNAAQCDDILSASQAGREVVCDSHRMVRTSNGVEIIVRREDYLNEILITSPGDFRGKLIEIRLTESRPKAISKDPMHAQMDADKVSYPFLVRRWKTGDEFQPLGSDFTVKVKKYLTDHKLGKLGKESQYVVESNDQIIWIPGLTISEKVKLTSASERAISMEFSYIRE